MELLKTTLIATIVAILFYITTTMVVGMTVLESKLTEIGITAYDKAYGIE